MKNLQWGAIATGDVRLVNENVVNYLGISHDLIDFVVAREQRELERRERLYRGRPREVESDFWLEDGMLFTGMALEMDAERGPSVEIMLQVPAAPTRDHLTHSVTGVKRVVLETVNGRDEALEIEDKEGAVTIMRFESEVPCRP